MERHISVVDVNFEDDRKPSSATTCDENSTTTDENDDAQDVPFPSFASYLINLWPAQSTTTAESHAAECGQKKAKLGTLLGVYLPSVQHTLNVQMFLRLLWIVGVAGVLESFFMVFLCCFCIFLTTISLSAIATNENVKGGGAYFMISRNLGSEFGGAIGILYFVANALATSLHLIGGIEILLLYIAPELPHFGNSVHDVHSHDDMINNFRIYATVFLILEFIICALGVKFVQIFAPLSLVCVILSILSIYIGSFVRNSSSSPTVCMLGDILLRPEVYMDNNDTNGCNKSEFGVLWKHFCSHNESLDMWTCDEYFLEKQTHVVFAIPGLFSGQTELNVWSTYMEAGEAIPGEKGDEDMEVVQDMSSNFFHLLAIFFPCVTDIMTGANMSGDLKNPRKSLPIGTIAAQLTTSFIYLSLVFVYGGSVHGSLLCDKFGASLNYRMVAAELAWPTKWIVLVGSFTATFGAALQCLCCAPRILQSIAKDDIVPWLKFFSPLTKHNEPFRALVLSTFLAECAILIGGVDHLSPIVDFFFLISYFSVNFACALLSLLGAPNWRPTFKYFHWSLSLLGAAMCIFIMFGTHWYYSLGVFALAGVIYKYIEYHSAESDWGDGMRGLALSTAQFSLLRIDAKPAHPKFWRPQIMVLIKVNGISQHRIHHQNDSKLLDLANQFKKGRGLTIITSFIETSYTSVEIQQQAKSVEILLKKLMEEKKIVGFRQVLISNQIAEDTHLAIKCTGIGALKANTVLIGWPTRWQESFKFGNKTAIKFLDGILRNTNKTIIVAKGLSAFPVSKDRLHGTVDIWINSHDGGITILLSFLLKRHRVWRSCKLRLFIFVDTTCDEEKLTAKVKTWLETHRIKCWFRVVHYNNSLSYDNNFDDCSALNLRQAEDMNKLIIEQCRLTRLVVLELPKLIDSKKPVNENYFAYIETLTTNLNRVLLIKGDGQDVLSIT